LASLNGLKGNVYARLVGPAWLIGLVGKATYERTVQPLQRLVHIQIAGLKADVHQISRLHALPRISSLTLSGPEFDDEMFDDVAPLPGLEYVWLIDSRVSAAGVGTVPPRPSERSD
jgi:hypothetical protein